MKIDFELAKRILEEEADQIRTVEVSGYWVEIVERLSQECRHKNKTMIAALGTAVLAKSTNPLVDVFSLQVGENKDSNTYSARALCKEVLAANANRLGIDLGVSGREPLNNQPFFGKERISETMKVRSDAQVSLGILVEALRELGKLKTQKQARNALRSFLQARKRKSAAITIPDDAGEGLDENDFVELITAFVAADSEGGKRAQAVAAGLLDILYGPDRIMAKRVNDPSRNSPGDISVLENNSGEKIERVFEVRDKPINTKDIEIFVDSVMRSSLSKAGMLAVSYDQEPLDIESSVRWAEVRQIRLRVFIGWEQIVKEALFWAEVPGLSIGAARNAIGARMAFHEVSDEGRKEWLEGK